MFLHSIINKVQKNYTGQVIIMNDRLKTCFKIFSECFPMVYVSEKIISEKLLCTEIFFRYEEGKTVGFAAVEGNSLAVICVLPEFQGKGYGVSLLAESEEYIKSKGFDCVVLGRNRSEIFRGAVMETLSHRFFENRGYHAYNGCLSMYIYTEEFQHRIKTPEGLVFRAEKDIISSEVLGMVKTVEPNWLKYCENCAGKTVITAERGGKATGFVIAETDAHTIITEEGCKTGLIGYAGVIPEERNKGTGLSMISWTTGYLKTEGCTEVFISYTSLDQWYAKIGYQEYLWYWMGEKKLT